MSSSLIIQVSEIKDVRNHPNADRLDIISIKGKGWETIVKRDEYKVGDVVIYIPTDVILPLELVEKLGIANYLAGKQKNRVKCARLRGEMSYGLVIPNEKNWEVGRDVAAELGIVKYEPPVRAMAGDAAPEDSTFHRYTDIENINNFPDIFKDGEMVVATEKIDGCFRYDQKVSLVNGEQISISEVEIGDMVLSYDEKEGEFVASKVEDVIIQNVSKQWVELSFDNGKEIVCTADHLFLTKNRRWVEAGDLEEEDELVTMDEEFENK